MPVPTLENAPTASDYKVFFDAAGHASESYSYIIKASNFFNVYFKTSEGYEEVGIPGERTEETVAYIDSGKSEVEGDIELLNNVFYTQDRLAVDTFLRNNTYLIELVFEAFPRIREVFGDYSELWLELVRDPEEGFEKLFIVIKSTLTAQEARARVRLLVREWFVDKMEITQHKLNITEVPL